MNKLIALIIVSYTSDILSSNKIMSSEEFQKSLWKDCYSAPHKEQQYKQEFNKLTLASLREITKYCDRNQGKLRIPTGGK